MFLSKTALPDQPQTFSTPHKKRGRTLFVSVVAWLALEKSGPDVFVPFTIGLSIRKTNQENKQIVHIVYFVVKNRLECIKAMTTDDTGPRFTHKSPL
jgi:hypothetical protein